MRAGTVLLALLSTASAASLNFFGGDVTPREDLEVPGKSPLEFCPSDHSNDILTIKSVDLSPNPPQAGVELVITAVAAVSQTITKGAYVNLQVKYGLIRLINTTADLCEQIENVDLECPIQKGLISITKSVDLPREIPPGKYTVLADAYTVDDEPITCLTATVTFARDGSVSVEL
ncbi:phosphatidylinositol/phosphatidylglycerol transfer protein [Sporothrix brasiliensis 5110]|uniref:Phosphatidylglycerol/phosphatidylinositol transfer protein n=1 Tax=Sporothrix brasiliensis 5110 TaxID=1398154 RepID=A0A0C2FSH0_9PEZI|nr:phosphatidylinositol/phosphatidylglycerol transfer protein [Sporothrix brasiliensis 5110]KIH93973.1 phosphatidylinositol/phosphatidylglycerol transfer protein [Sporothrix brasiliensis 5110]